MMFVWICLAVIYPELISAYMGVESILAKDILENYTANARPSPSPDATVDIGFMFMLAKIEKLDEKNQQMICFGWMLQTWLDIQLMWDPRNYQNATSVIIPASKVWRPEVALFNSMSNLDDLSFKDNSRVMVEANGLVFWAQGLRWVTQCDVDLRFFPFDTQVCDVRFTNWVHSESFLNFTNVIDRVLLDAYEENGEWDLITADTFRVTMTYPGTPPPFSENRYPQVGFRLKLTRIPTYFLYNIVAPVMILSLLTALVFVLPSDAGEKVSMQVTILLSHSVLLLVISDTTPRSGKSTPIITEFITAAMCLTAIALITTVFLLNVYHHSATKPVPKWVKKLVFGFLMKCLCMKCACCKKDNWVKSDGLPNWAMALTNPATRPVAPSSADLKNLPEDDMFPDYIRQYILRKTEADEENAALSQNKDDWQRVSRVLDRLFFWMYLLTTFALTTGTILNLTG